MRIKLSLYMNHEYMRSSCDQNQGGLLKLANDEEQIITCYPIDGSMGSSDAGWVRQLSVVCLHQNPIVARGILVNILHSRTPEPRLSAIYIVGSVGTSLEMYRCKYPNGKRY